LGFQILAEYYFDIETTGTNFDKDEIITIQWKRLGNTGEPMGELNILKRWESSEKEILKMFAPNLTCNPWDFVFVGKNLTFDFNMQNQRMKNYNLGEFNLRCLHERLAIDIKPVLVLMNDCRFAGHQRLMPKTNPLENKDIPELFREGKFAEITKYIQDETQDFIKVYQTLRKEMPSLTKYL